MIRDHGDDLRVELAAARAPQQVDEAVVVAGDHDRDAPALTPPADLPVHLKPRRHLLLKARLPVLARSGQIVEEELGAQEEAPAARIGGVLV